MDRRKVGAGVLCVIILFSAAVFYLTPEDKGVEEFRNNADSSSYQINYSVDFNESFVGSQYNYSSFELYSKNERYKSVVRYQRKGTQYRNTSFIAGNKSLLCKEITSPTITPENCFVGDSVTQFFYDLIYAAPDYRAEINGTKNVSGHICSQFMFTTRKEFVPNGEALAYSPEIKMCLDNEEGYVASININGYIRQENSTERISIANITAEEVNRDYNSDPMPKFDLVMNTYCDSSDSRLEVISLGDEESITVEVSGYNETFDLTPYRSSDIYLPRNRLENGSNHIMVYSSQGSRKLSCDYSSE